MLTVPLGKLGVSQNSSPLGPINLFLQVKAYIFIKGKHFHTSSACSEALSISDFQPLITATECIELD